MWGGASDRLLPLYAAATASWYTGSCLWGLMVTQESPEYVWGEIRRDFWNRVRGTCRPGSSSTVGWHWPEHWLTKELKAKGLWILTEKGLRTERDSQVGVTGTWDYLFPGKAGNHQLVWHAHRPFKDKEACWRQDCRFEEATLRHWGLKGICVSAGLGTWCFRPWGE